MKVIQKIIRIYGINDNDEESFLGYFKDFKSKTIELKDFPRKDEKIQISIGEPIKSVFKSNKIKMATGTAFLKKISGLTDINDLKTLIKKELETITKETITKYPDDSDYNMYVTFIYEKEVEIDDTYIWDDECYWLDLKEVPLIEQKLRPYISKYFDILINYLALISDVNFFNNKIIDDLTLFSASGKREIGVIKFKTSVNIQEIPASPIDFNDFESKITNDNASGNFKKCEFLEYVSHFRLAAIREEDPWKHYYLSFNALEILIETSVKNIYKRIEHRINLEMDDKTYSNISSLPINITKDVNEFNLKDRFGILASELFPEDAEEDLKIFKELKKNRDSMSHGRPINPDELPISFVDFLLTKYLNKIMENTLGL